MHKGNLASAMKVLEPYLPAQGSNASSVYSEGGALYALGLIYASKGAANGEVVAYLQNALQSSPSEVRFPTFCSRALSRVRLVVLLLLLCCAALWLAGVEARRVVRSWSCLHGHRLRGAVRAAETHH